MGTRRLPFCLFPLFAALVFPARAELVHVYEQTVAGAATNQLSDAILDTGSNYVTQTAPAIDGWVFAKWSISTKQSFSGRDRWGRAWNAAPYTLYEETTLTAYYLPATQDEDGDGVADGHEIYWYGDLAQTADSDTDGDGFTFAEELAKGTNPLLQDTYGLGGVECADSALLLYNPFGYRPYILRSDPEAALFATSTNWVRPGMVVTTPSYDHASTVFGYWTRDGVRQADRWGRALDEVTFVMPSNTVEFVAMTDTDSDVRDQMYWYGGRTYLPDSDTDGDGLMFAEERTMGTNPLLFDDYASGGIEWEDSAMLLYNPFSMHPYTWRSEPAGVLFESATNWVRPGTVVTTPTCDHLGTAFSYWTSNGAEQRDRWGRALDLVSFAMPSNDVNLVAVTKTDEMLRQQLYWYGTEQSLDSDTDSDGFTFAEELTMGTSPLFADMYPSGGIEYADTALMEANLQVYEQVQGAIVGGAYSQMFTSPIAGNAATSATFGNGGAVWPVVADVNNDGLWDLIVCWEGGVKVFVNVGSKGNPEFEVDASGALGERALPWIGMNSTEKLDTLTLDVPPPVDALSATTNGTALLVSDSAGRIWYYQLSTPTQDSNSNYTLQHKVWGGSRAGFAEGLRLAAVDWDDDGDLDCLAGTADGKLMLLRDPKVGRPTNLKALAGVDNILLTWDPNQQSRIRGYRVYRSLPEQDGASPSGTRIAQPPLPTYRDFPPTTDEYAYKVSSVSRFYTAGNSTPTETESPATEAVVAKTGGVKFFWNDAVAKVGEKVEVMLSIENSMNYNVADKSQVVSYDPEYLEPVKVVKTGLTEEFDIVDSHSEQGGASPSGAWQIAITGAAGGGTPTLPAGGGKFLILVFEAQKEGTTTVGGETGATVSIAAGAAIAPYQLGDIDGDGDVDVEDLRLLAKLKNGTGRKHTANQLKAGDFNGNGKLDNADYQALRELLKEMGNL